MSFQSSFHRHLDIPGYVRSDPTNAPIWSIDVSKLCLSSSQSGQLTFRPQFTYSITSVTLMSTLKRFVSPSMPLHGCYSKRLEKVLSRCYHSMIPREDYVSVILESRPDLYGPFWTLTTVIFALFVFSSLASSITSYMSAKVCGRPWSRTCALLTLCQWSALGLRLQTSQLGSRNCLCIWTWCTCGSVGNATVASRSRLGRTGCCRSMGLRHDDLDVRSNLYNIPFSCAA